MNINDFKKYIEDLIANGHTVESIQLLKFFVGDETTFGADLNIEMIMLSNQYFDVQNKEFLGIAPQNDQKNRITLSVVQLLHKAVKLLPNAGEALISEELLGQIELVKVEIEEKKRKKNLLKAGIVTGGISSIIVISLLGTNIILIIMAGIALVVGFFYLNDKV